MVKAGNDLSTQLQISLHEALTGFRRPLAHLDGRQVELRPDPSPHPKPNPNPNNPTQVELRSDLEVTRPGQAKRVRGLGMPVHRAPHMKGDLIVRFAVKFPTVALTGESAKMLAKLLPRSAAGGSPKAGAQVHHLESLLDDEEE